MSGDRILHETTNNETIYYEYDGTGKVSGFVLDNNRYTYVKNGLNDIIGILDSSANLVATYKYDAWGNVSVNNLTNDNLGDLNPFRYRGYYYDSETGYYYLNSRYYDPVVKRLINADSYVSTGQGILGHNMFAYCNNNPIANVDINGGMSVQAEIFGLPPAPYYQPDASSYAYLGVIGGGSAGASLGAAVVTVTAINKSKIIEKSQENEYSVYKLQNDVGEIKYIGRTKNVDARKAAHKRDENRKDLHFEVIKSDLRYDQARGLEQILMLHYHTINYSKDKDLLMINQINGISPNNRNIEEYMKAGAAIAWYIDNQISNEILNWRGE